MTPDTALCVIAALVVARVSTLVADAGQTTVAIRVNDALRSAVWRASQVVLEARARSASLVLTALGVGAAGARCAWTGNLLRD